MKVKRFLLILSALIIVVNVSAQQSGGGRQNGGDPAARFISVAEESLKSRYITVGGRLNPLRRIIHTFTVAGVVDSIPVKLGQRIVTGDPLVSLVRESPGESYLPVILESRIDGRVSEIFVSPKSEVRVGANAVTIIDDSAMMLEAALSDRDIQKVSSLVGKPVKALSADEESFDGILASVSTEPDYTTGLYTVSFRFPLVKGLHLGKVLFIDLPVEVYSGIYIPQDLVQRRFGRSLMWLVDAEDKLVLQPVSAGDPYNDEVHIVRGLSPGDRYLSRLSGREKEGITVQELFSPPKAE